MAAVNAEHRASAMAARGRRGREARLKWPATLKLAPLSLKVEHRAAQQGRINWPFARAFDVLDDVGLAGSLQEHACGGDLGSSGGSRCEAL
jgi:hypothetical protein